MLKFGLKNFKSFIDSGDIEIKPITILVGKNSVGKSTIARIPPLVKQSLETRSNTPIVWYGDQVDLGSISDVKSKFTEDKDVVIQLGFQAANLTRRSPSQAPSYVGYRQAKIKLKDDEELRVSLYLTEADENTIVSKFEISLADDLISFSLDPDGSMSAVFFNEIDITLPATRAEFEFDTTTLIPTPIRQHSIPRVKIGDSIYWSHIDPLVYFEFRKFIRLQISSRFGEERIQEFAERLAAKPKTTFDRRVRIFRQRYATWERAAKNGSDGLIFEKLRALLFLGTVGPLIEELNSYLSKYFLRVGYIAPSRATGQRYYRIQELSVDSIDPEGKNLPAFLYSLDYYKQRQFANWTNSLLGFEASAKAEHGHISIYLKDADTEQNMNLADVGYGYSQLLPVLAQLWMSSKMHTDTEPKLISIEQPELHLHPAFQSRLADVFVASIYEIDEDVKALNNISLLIETHSEQLVTRLGSLIRSGQLNSEDVIIHVFQTSEEFEGTAIQTATYDKDGDLRNWPFGFFLGGN